VIPIQVPALRDRSGDIPALVGHFSRLIAREVGRPAAFTREALERLARHPFPGNVRELRNLVERLVVMNPGQAIGAEAVRAVLPEESSASAGGSHLADAVRRFERAEIERALEAEGGNVTRAASRLGLERSHLYKKMKQLGMRTEN
jgi:two-component system nitrogen regulation response regulator NtrX